MIATTVESDAICPASQRFPSSARAGRRFASLPERAPSPGERAASPPSLPPGGA